MLNGNAEVVLALYDIHLMVKNMKLPMVTSNQKGTSQLHWIKPIKIIKD